jgi:hypothetical protein
LSRDLKRFDDGPDRNASDHQVRIFRPDQNIIGRFIDGPTSQSSIEL